MGTVFEGVVITVVVAVFLVWALLGVLVFTTVRGIRRLYLRCRTRLAEFGGPNGSAGFHASTVSAASASTIGSPAWWGVQRDRHRMWRAVSCADHAVGVARRSGAPVGDLPTLARQLEAAAQGVDAVLCASARTASLRREARTERLRIEAAAADVHRAAMDSLTMTAVADTDGVVAAARTELAALAEGLRIARTASTR